MKISHLSQPRYRLIYRILALVIVVGALSSTPAPANVEPPPCQFGCIHWVKGIGCLDCKICFVDSRGNFTCTHDFDLRNCGTGVPGSD